MERIYDIETSLTLDYRKGRWGIERIVIDGASNHLPADSKGTHVNAKVKQAGNYIDFRQADKSLPIEEVVFEDNGVGYDAGLLSVLFSSKSADALSVGQFGEGLKLVAAASLREGLKIEYHSRNWIAVPYAKEETIGNNPLKRLCFQITENGFNVQGSRTVIKNPSEAFLQELYKLPDNILAFNDKHKEVYNERNNIPVKGPFNYFNNLPKYKDRIIDLGTGETSLFIKGVRVEKKKESIFSYDLGLEDITPDRIFADRNVVLSSIEKLLKNCSDPAVI